jgi:hypothetical protein
VKLSRVLASVLSLAIGLMPVAAPEHVHERDDHGHARVVVHRHMQPHGLAEHHREHDGAFEHDDTPILTLSAIYTVPGSLVVSGPERLATTLLETPEEQRIERSRPELEISIHGPPRAPTGLRAPPFAPAS